MRIIELLDGSKLDECDQMRKGLNSSCNLPLKELDQVRMKNIIVLV